MAERFVRLFKMQEDLYANESPVVISAAVLLKDNFSNNVIAQIKWQSVSVKIISAVKIMLNSYDVTGEKLSGNISYQYLDLNARKGAFFGGNKAIIMPNTIARSFSIEEIEVVFADGATWKKDSIKDFFSLKKVILCKMN